MQAFTTHQGLVAPFDRDNVDTDLIIPKQFLKSIKRTGFGPNLFDEIRYLDHGEPGMDNSQRPLNPDFVLNHARYQGASILLCRKNFGCGSSREHAPWALQQYGFRALIAPSYADIFFNNSFKNGLLPIVLPEDVVDQLFKAVTAQPRYSLIVSSDREHRVAAQRLRYRVFASEPGFSLPASAGARLAVLPDSCKAVVFLSTTAAVEFYHAGEGPCCTVLCCTVLCCAVLSWLMCWAVLGCVKLCFQHHWCMWLGCELVLRPPSPVFQCSLCCLEPRLLAFPPL